VFELSHVAGPIVRDERIHDVGSDSLNRPGVSLAHLFDEVPDQHLDVVAAVAERRQLQGHDCQAIVEIGTKTALGNGAFQIATGGRNHPCVGEYRLGRTESLEPAILLGEIGLYAGPTVAVYAAAGMAAALTSIAGVPLASIALVVEAFGSEYSPAAAVACAVCFTVSRRFGLYARTPNTEREEHDR